MNVRQAIFMAADRIENNPGDFLFEATKVPHQCGSPGCALGWIGHYLGIAAGNSFHAPCNAMGIARIAPMLDGSGEFTFYRRMDELLGSTYWANDSSACARALRLYADKYHPAAKGTDVLIPASVRAIFDMTPAQLAREFERV